MAKPNRRYQVLPDQGYCLEPGCSWRVDGPAAEAAAEAHNEKTFHEAQVLTGAKVIFTRRAASRVTPAQALAAAKTINRDTRDAILVRRADLIEATP
jgi:hypothetical protein